MTLAEKIHEVVKTLPKARAAEVLQFVERLKSTVGGATSKYFGGINTGVGTSGFICLLPEDF